MESKPVLILLFVVLVIFAWSMVGFIGKLQVTKENKEIAEKKVAELEKEKADYEAKIAKLKTPEGVEETIRDTYGLAKEGEGLIVVVDDKNNPNKSNNSEGGFFSHLMFWKNWFK